MEVAQELRVILQNNQDDVHRGSIEATHRRRSLLAGDQVLLYESEAVHQQVLDLVQLLELDVGLVLLQLGLRNALSVQIGQLLVHVAWCLSLVLLRILVELIQLGLRLHLDEVRHEELVRDKL